LALDFIKSITPISKQKIEIVYRNKHYTVKIGPFNSEKMLLSLQQKLKQQGFKDTFSTIG